jgi:CRISPR-associated protein Cmr5
VVAYLQDKGGRHDTLGQHLRQWLRRRFPQQITGDDFPSFMQSLLKMKEPGDYQAITAEAFAWLRWLRQMAAARNGDNNA